MAATVKEFQINLTTNDSGTRKSIKELQSLFNQLQKKFKNLTIDDPEFDKTANELKLVSQALNDAKKEMNDLTRATKDASEEIDSLGGLVGAIGDKIEGAFDKEALKNFAKEAISGLATLDEEAITAQSTVGKVAEFLSNLGPAGRVAAGVVTVAFKGIEAAINLSGTAAAKFKAVFDSLKVAAKGAFEGLGQLLTGEFSKAFDTFSGLSDRVAAERSASFIRYVNRIQIAQLNALREVKEAEEDRFDKEQSNTALSFKQIEQALQARKKAAKEATSAELQAAQLELDNFYNTDAIKRKIQLNGAEFASKLEDRQLKALKELGEEESAQLLELQGKRDAALQKQLAKENEYIKDSLDNFRNEQQYKIDLLNIRLQKEVDANQFRLDNERVSLKDGLALLTENFDARQDLLNREIANIEASAKKQAELTGKPFQINKEDVKRLEEIYAEIESNRRQFALETDTFKRQIEQNEIARQQALLDREVQTNLKKVELGKISVEAQNKLLQEGGDKQVEILKRTQANLNKQDKDYLVQYEQLQNQILQTNQDTQDKILANTLKNQNLILANELAALNQLQAERNLAFQQLQNNNKELNSDIDARIEKTNFLISNTTGLIKKLNGLKELQQLDIQRTQEQIKQLKEQADLQTQTNNNAISQAKAKINALENEAKQGDKLTEERKAQIQQETDALVTQIETLEESNRGIEIDVKINTDKLNDQLDRANQERRQKVFQAVADEIGKYQELYGQLTEVILTFVDIQTQAVLDGIDKQIAASEERVAQNEKQIERLNEIEDKTTGARAKRAAREAAAIEKANEREAKSQQALAEEREAAERKAAKLKKILATGQIVIDTAKAIAGVVASTSFDPTGILRAIQIGLVTALGAAQIAAVNTVKFANGGVVQGPGHDQGGVKYAMGGNMVELEGNEGVINKRSMASTDTMTVSGTPRQIASAINSYKGYGVKFQAGGVISGASAFTTTPGNNIGIGTDRDLLAQILTAVREQRPVLSIPEFNKASVQLDNNRQNAFI